MVSSMKRSWHWIFLCVMFTVDANLLFPKCPSRRGWSRITFCSLLGTGNMFEERYFFNVVNSQNKSSQQVLFVSKLRHRRNMFYPHCCPWCSWLIGVTSVLGCSHSQSCFFSSGQISFTYFAVLNVVTGTDQCGWHLLKLNCLRFVQQQHLLFKTIELFFVCLFSSQIETESDCFQCMSSVIGSRANSAGTKSRSENHRISHWVLCWTDSGQKKCLFSFFTFMLGYVDKICCLHLALATLITLVRNSHFVNGCIVQTHRPKWYACCWFVNSFVRAQPHPNKVKRVSRCFFLQPCWFRLV